MRDEPGLIATSAASSLMATLIVWTALMFIGPGEDGSICFGGGSGKSPACPAAPCHAVCNAANLKPKKLPFA